MYTHVVWIHIIHIYTSLYMCIYIHVYTHIYMFIHVYIYTCLYTYIHVYACMLWIYIIHTYMYKHVYMCVSIHKCIYVCGCIYLYARIVCRGAHGLTHAVHIYYMCIYIIYIHNVQILVWIISLKIDCLTKLHELPKFIICKFVWIYTRTSTHTRPIADEFVGPSIQCTHIICICI